MKGKLLRILGGLALLLTVAAGVAIARDGFYIRTDISDSTTFDGNESMTVTWNAEWTVSATFDCRGTWGSGTMTAEVTIDGTNYVTAQDGAGDITCTADCAKQWHTSENGPYKGYRLTLSGATAPSLTCTVQRVLRRVP